jgi:hypothetical protein
MPEPILYQRGPYQLRWDRTKSGALRSPFPAIFWYDTQSGRERSASSRTADVESAKAALDRHYEKHSQGRAICSACGQAIQSGRGYLVTEAITAFLAHKGIKAGAARPRLNHIVRYIATLPNPSVFCEAIDENWISNFRTWAMVQPIVTPTGREKPRSLSTAENSVLQLAAAINPAHRKHNTLFPAGFTPIPMKTVNRSPWHRADMDELKAMFRYAAAPKMKRGNLLRFLQISLATLARPDAAYEVSTDPKRRQWNSNARVLDLNPQGRMPTKKRRAIVPVAWQMARLLDQVKGPYVGVGSVRTAWRVMSLELGLPQDGESGMKLIRRSMAKLLRDRLEPGHWAEITMFMGHRVFEATSDIYAPFDPSYLGHAREAIEAIISEIEALVPGAFHRTDTGAPENIIPLGASKNA